MAVNNSTPHSSSDYALRPQHDKIKLAVKYIEEHIDSAITLEDLLDITGLSYSHFCYLFKEGTGFSPKNYIRLRSMHQAARFMIKGASVTDVAKRYGYKNIGNFTRAFTNNFGVSPHKYIHNASISQNVPELRYLEGRFLVGFRFDAPDESFNYLEHAAYWQHQVFDPKLASIYNIFAPSVNGEAGVWVPKGKDGQSRSYYVYGTPVQSDLAKPAELCSVLLRAGTYAIFDVLSGETFAENANNLRDMLHYAVYDWLPSSGFFLDDSTPIIEYYLGESIYLALPIKQV